MRDYDSDDRPVVLLRLPPERELPRCRCDAAGGTFPGVMPILALAMLLARRARSRRRR